MSPPDATIRRMGCLITCMKRDSMPLNGPLESLPDNDILNNFLFLLNKREC